MIIYIASDHAGFEMKRALIEHLSQSGHHVYDCGPETYDPADDYPDYISRAAHYVSEKSHDLDVFGVVLGGNGQGEAIVANRFPGVRCAVFYGGNKHTLTTSRQDDGANMLSFGARFLTTHEATQAVDLWLGTKFSGEARHVRRLKKIAKIEEILKTE